MEDDPIDNVISHDYSNHLVGFTKLFSTIVHSTVWRTDMHVKIVWVTMLAMADRNGRVMASVPGLADAARVSLEQCVDALRVLSEPDEWSRTKSNQGRRIEAIEGGWQLLNYLKYREMRDADQRRIQVREAVKKHRQTKAAGNPLKATVSHGKPQKAQAEAEAEAESRTDQEPEPRAAEEPRWRPAGARRADPSMRDLDYHRRHCPIWAQAACEAGICVPKYLWPQWEKRRPINDLEAFIGAWASRAAGDAAENFWPRAFEAHFGTSAPSVKGDKVTRVRSALDEALAINAAERKAVGDGRQ